MRLADSEAHHHLHHATTDDMRGLTKRRVARGLAVTGQSWLPMGARLLTPQTLRREAWRKIDAPTSFSRQLPGISGASLIAVLVSAKILYSGEYIGREGRRSLENTGGSGVSPCRASGTPSHGLRRSDWPAAC
jgi:hypothetical protein